MGKARRSPRNHARERKENKVTTLTQQEFEELEARYEAGTANADDLELLESYRAKRAVLLASGFGSRMRPITINTPKPLVRVNGKRIIDSLIEPLLKLGIEEIYIVVGYLAEEFELLKRSYPSITLIHNPLFATTNNISSALAASEHFQNAYVFESDLLLKNPSLLKRYNYSSFYLGVPVESTPDWCFETQGEQGGEPIITNLKKGGEHCHHMFGISYWTQEDGAKLVQDFTDAFNANEENKQRFWDDVPCVLMQDHYQVRVRECSFADIAEIDSLRELQELDPSYRIE